MKGLIILKLFKKKTEDINKTEMSDISEKIKLYSIISDLTTIVGILVKASSSKIEPELLTRITSVMDKMKMMLSTEINNTKECTEITEIEEIQLLEYLGMDIAEMDETQLLAYLDDMLKEDHVGGVSNAK